MGAWGVGVKRSAGWLIGKCETPGVTGRNKPRLYTANTADSRPRIVQELCESRGGRPGLPALTSLLVSVDVKLY